jgi:hypothetical protein
MVVSRAYMPCVFSWHETAKKLIDLVDNSIPAGLAQPSCVAHWILIKRVTVAMYIP